MCIVVPCELWTLVEGDQDSQLPSTLEVVEESKLKPIAQVSLSHKPAALTQVEAVAHSDCQVTYEHVGVFPSHLCDRMTTSVVTVCVHNTLKQDHTHHTQQNAHTTPGHTQKNTHTTPSWQHQPHPETRQLEPHPEKYTDCTRRHAHSTPSRQHTPQPEEYPHCIPLLIRFFP